MEKKEDDLVKIVIVTGELVLRAVEACKNIWGQKKYLYHKSIRDPDVFVGSGSIFLKLARIRFHHRV